jgi:hypothetical protein
MSMTIAPSAWMPLQSIGATRSSGGSFPAIMASGRAFLQFAVGRFDENARSDLQPQAGTMPTTVTMPGDADHLDPRRRSIVDMSSGLVAAVAVELLERMMPPSARPPSDRM